MTVADFWHDVTMRNTPHTAQDLNLLCDATAPAVDTRCMGSTATETVFRISGTRQDVEKVVRAGERMGLW